MALYEFAAREGHLPKQTDDQLRQIGADAKPLNDDDYGSTDCIARQNVFFILMEQAGYNVDEFETMKATPEEMIDLALDKLGKPSPGRPTVGVRRCLDEFPSFPASAFPEIPVGFEDSSWHNDVCPSIADEKRNLLIFIDFTDPADREFPETIGRFTVTRLSDTEQLLTTDSWETVLAYIAKVPSTRSAAPTFEGTLQVSKAGEIAFRFAQILKEQLSPETFAEMKAKNEDPGQTAGVCASHDYVDANEVMLEAFKTVMGRQPLLHSDNETIAEIDARDADWSMMAKAWDLARGLYIGEALVRWCSVVKDRYGAVVSRGAPTSKLVAQAQASQGNNHAKPGFTFIVEVAS